MVRHARALALAAAATILACVPAAAPSPTLGVSSASVTSASAAPRAPADFTLPSGCQVIGTPRANAGTTEWQVDCGADRNRDGRGTLGPALLAQGWTSCGQGLASATWAKSNLVTVVSESSGVPGDYIHVGQRVRGTECT